MAARQRRRRPGAPAGLRRWFRRHRPGRWVLFAAVVIGALSAWLALAPDGDKGRERRLSEPVAGPAKPARTSVPRPAARAKSPSRAPSVTPASPPAADRVAQNAQAPEPAPPRERAAPVPAPRAAIVIDDLGQRLSQLEQVATLEIPLTIAVIPGLPATEAIVREASRRGLETILHQPMEPREEGGKNPGPGVLLTTMDAARVRALLREGLAAVPNAVGVNNHMGSRFTEQPEGLAAVMAELRGRDLFWLDSRTTAATRGAETARAAGVRTLERDVFLDAKVDEAFTRRQVRRLLALARTRGSAVGIGHPHPQTIAALRGLRDELLGSGVALVRLSALLPARHDAPGTAVAAAARAERQAPTPAGAGATP